MLGACYRHAVPTLQVKNLPAELHRAVRDRAATEHLTMSEWVTRTLRTELERPSLPAWIERMQLVRRVAALDVDSALLIDEIRADVDGDPAVRSVPPGPGRVSRPGAG